jgi:hypothetical protein
LQWIAKQQELKKRSFHTTARPLTNSQPTQDVKPPVNQITKPYKFKKSIPIPRFLQTKKERLAIDAILKRWDAAIFARTRKKSVKPKKVPRKPEKRVIFYKKVRENTPRKKRRTRAIIKKIKIKISHKTRRRRTTLRRLALYAARAHYQTYKLFEKDFDLEFSARCVLSEYNDYRNLFLSFAQQKNRERITYSGLRRRRRHKRLMFLLRRRRFRFQKKFRQAFYREQLRLFKTTKVRRGQHRDYLTLNTTANTVLAEVANSRKTLTFPRAVSNNKLIAKLTDETPYRSQQEHTLAQRLRRKLRRDAYTLKKQKK